jgi:hypothetical protein
MWQLLFISNAGVPIYSREILATKLLEKKKNFGEKYN